MDSIIKKITRLLEERIGLNPASLGEGIWPRIIRERMVLSGSINQEEYYEKLVLSTFEFQEFVELVVVPETWFFRDVAAIEFVAQIILKWKSDNTIPHSFRILSIPCSTGEEPYSLAMILLDAGIPADQFHIDAFDISKKALEKASHGIYGHRSFRMKNFEYQNAYFKKVAAGYQISPRVMRQVTFSYGNLCDSRFSHDFAYQYYDVIFCRNLFIYFHPAAQKNAASLFQTILKDDGILIVSSSEIELIKRQGFVSHPNIRACAFIKVQEHERLRAADKLLPLPEIRTKTVVNQLSVPPMPPPPPVPANLFEKAQYLADNGEFSEATSLCLESLKKEGVDPKLFFLLGVIHLAIGKDQKAEEFFLKVVYLKPFHPDALFHLALLAEKRGDIQQAKLYRDRSYRAQS
jgi:chemotaxis protein methyltransferase WspC